MGCPAIHLLIALNQYLSFSVLLDAPRDVFVVVVVVVVVVVLCVCVCLAHNIKKLAAANYF